MINNPSHAQETFHSTHLGELGRDATGRDDAPAQDGSSHDDAEVLWIVTVEEQSAGGGYVHRAWAQGHCLYHGRTKQRLIRDATDKSGLVRY